MLSLRGNRDDSNSDTDDSAYSSYDESMQNFQVNESNAPQSNISTTGYRRQHDFLKREDDDQENLSDDLEDTNVVSRLQRFIDSVDKHSYELMSLVRGHDWKAAMNMLVELNKCASYIVSQGTRIPYSFLSALKFSQDFFNQAVQEDEDGSAEDFLAQLRQETPKELRKTLSDFHREVMSACEERAQQIERMDDDDSEDDDSESSDVDIEELLNLGHEGSSGEGLEESLAAAVLGGKEGFSLAALVGNEEVTEENIMNKLQELRLKLASGIAEKSSKDSDKRLKRMKRSRSALFSLTMQSILREVEASGKFPKSQALLCSLLFADCFGERRQESVQKHLHRDYRSLAETFPAISPDALCNTTDAPESIRHARLEKTSVRQWLMAAEYMNRYLQVLKNHPDVKRLILAHEESNRKGNPIEAFGVDISVSLLVPFTMASRLIEEYLEAIRSTQLHDSLYLRWLQAESILLYMFERTLLVYRPRDSNTASSPDHLEQALHLSDHMLFLLHYRTDDVHGHLFNRYYSQILPADGNHYVKHNLVESIEHLRKISQTQKAAADFPALSLRSTLYLIHSHAANERVTEAMRLFRVMRCDERARALSGLRGSLTADEYSRGDVRNHTIVAYNRVLARLGIALFSRGKIQSAGDFLIQLYVPQTQQGTQAFHSVYAKELLLAQLSLRHETALRFSSMPCLEGTGNTEPAIEPRIVRMSLERILLPASRTSVEDVYLPPHLHLNIELLDCIFYVYCMMYQEGTFRRGAHRFMSEPKPYRAFLGSYERQNFLKDPETNKDMVYAAILAFRNADWENCCAKLAEVPLFRNALSTSNAIQEVTTSIKIECVKKFMFGARGVFSNLRIDHLSEKFALPESEIRRIIVQMVVRRELHGAFLDERETAIEFDHVQHTPLQKSVLQLSEKIVGTLDCVQRAQDYKHMQKLYNHPESFGKGSFFFRNRQRGKGRSVYEGEHPLDDSASTETMPQENMANYKETRKIRGGSIRSTPTRYPFATLRGNRFVTR